MLFRSCGLLFLWCFLAIFFIWTFAFVFFSATGPIDSICVVFPWTVFELVFSGLLTSIGSFAIWADWLTRDTASIWAGWPTKDMATVAFISFLKLYGRQRGGEPTASHAPDTCIGTCSRRAELSRPCIAFSGSFAFPRF